MRPLVGDGSFPLPLVGVGLSGLGIAVAALALDPARGFPAWLYAAVLLATLPVGALGILLIHHLTGGRWGLAARPALRPAAATAPLVGLLFLPLFLGLGDLFPWTRPQAQLAEAVVHKLPYLNPPFLAARTVLYFALWSVIAAALGAWRRAAPDEPPPRRRRAAAWGAILWGLAVTFFAVDWIMSLQPRFYSSMIGFLFAAVCVVAAMAWVVLAHALNTRAGEREPDVLQRSQDLGNLLLAAILFWGYIAFMRFLIVWIADLPDEILWYTARDGGWSVVMAAVTLLYGAIPFLCLLSRRVKRDPRALGVVGAIVLAGHLANVAWLLAPSFDPAALAQSAYAAVALLGLGGAWLAAFLALGGHAALKGEPG